MGQEDGALESVVSAPKEMSKSVSKSEEGELFQIGTSQKYLIIAGDIGGTNCRLQLVQSSADSLEDSRILCRRKYDNDKYKLFSDALCEFFADPVVMAAVDANHGHTDVACLAVAGPVDNDHINFTNREGWIIDGRDLEQSFGIGRVSLINDFAANGHGIEALHENDIVTIQHGEKLPGAPIALVGAGTGLGECYLTKARDDDSYQVFATEGGHTDFAPRNDIETELLVWMREKVKGRVSVERIVSGRGLQNVYEFLAHRTQMDDMQLETHKRIMSQTDIPFAISSSRFDYSLAMQAVQMFLSAYGSEVGNVALKYLPRGGLYIAGGIAPKLLDAISETGSGFMVALYDKGRLRSRIENIPIYVVTLEDLGLRGAHVMAFRLLHAAHAAPLPVLEFRTTSLRTAAMKTASVGAKIGSALKRTNRAFLDSFSDYSVFWALGISITTSAGFAMLITAQFTKLVREGSLR
ncbi:Glucokinase [Porphyridium purpureum]|uniref:Glucokinase n=1 Tax=Porphyridium purpureum TaxID=35688 RepID=A0A5J4Z743_PORPP|nr:Glucokinase [Porphyridium purpureum]|eukprot:POR2873..scf295_1